MNAINHEDPPPSGWFAHQCPRCAGSANYQASTIGTLVICPHCNDYFDMPPGPKPLFEPEQEPEPKPFRDASQNLRQFVRRHPTPFKAAGLLLFLITVLWGLAKLPLAVWEIVLPLLAAAAIVFVCWYIYFTPTRIAKDRSHRNEDAIFLINFLLGWTVLGWVVALVWAVYRDKDEG